jgi:hypothetical protein
MGQPSSFYFFILVSLVSKCPTHLCLCTPRGHLVWPLPAAHATSPCPHHVTGCVTVHPTTTCATSPCPSQLTMPPTLPQSRPRLWQQPPNMQPPQPPQLQAQPHCEYDHDYEHEHEHKHSDNHCHCSHSSQCNGVSTTTTT